MPRTLEIIAHIGAADMMILFRDGHTPRFLLALSVYWMIRQAVLTPFPSEAYYSVFQLGLMFVIPIKFVSLFGRVLTGRASYRLLHPRGMIAWGSLGPPRPVLWFGVDPLLAALPGLLMLTYPSKVLEITGPVYLGYLYLLEPHHWLPFVPAPATLEQWLPPLGGLIPGDRQLIASCIPFVPVPFLCLNNYCEWYFSDEERREAYLRRREKGPEPLSFPGVQRGKRRPVPPAPTVQDLLEAQKK